MKKYFVLMLVLISVKVFPQQQSNQPQMENITSYNSKADKVAKYQKMQTNGIILASVGGAALIGGVALYISGAIDASNSTTFNNSGYSNTPTIPGYAGKLVGGAALGLVGGLAIAGGIVMIKIGKRKEIRANNRVSVFVLPNTFRIAYKF